MLGHPADRRRAVPHGLPVRPDPRPGRPEDVEDEGQRRRPARGHRRGPAPTRSASRSIHGATPGQRPALRRRRSSRTPATSPTSSGTRPGSCSARGRRRSRPTPSGGCPDAAPPRPGRALDPVARRGHDRAVDAAMADYSFGEVTRLALRRDLERVLRLGPRAGQGPPGRRVAAGADARGDLVDAGRGARHVPAAAPPGHAVRDRGAVGRAARTAPTDPELLIVARWPAAGRARPDGRGRGRGAHRARPRHPQRPRRGAARAGALAAGRRRRAADARRRVRGAAAGHRAARPGPAARRRHLTREALHGPRARPATWPSSPASSRRSSRDRHAPSRGAADRRTGPARDASWPRPRAGWRPPALASPTTRSRPGAAGRRRGRARPRGRAGRPGRAAARAPRPLTGPRRRREPAVRPRPGGRGTSCRYVQALDRRRRAALPKRRAAGEVARSPHPRAELPEEIAAQDYSLRLYYAGKSSEGVRMKPGRRPRGAAGDAHRARQGRDRGRRAARVEYAQADPTSRGRPRRCSGSTPTIASPITRHALVVLESIDAIDLAFDTFACALLDGETDTSGYPEYNAVVGGVASHWDEVTGDMIVRGVVGWGGKGVRGDTDRTARGSWAAS